MTESDSTRLQNDTRLTQSVIADVILVRTMFVSKRNTMVVINVCLAHVFQYLDWARHMTVNSKVKCSDEKRPEQNDKAAVERCMLPTAQK